jgi:replicative DNA helicase
MDEPPPHGIEGPPPHNLDAERALLGGILVDGSALEEVAFLRPESFYRQAHGAIFAAMRAVASRGSPPDVVLVADELERSGDLEPFGLGYLARLGNDCRTSVFTEQYGRIVERTATYRRLIAAAGRIAAIAYEDDSADVRERCEAELRSVWERP